MIVLQDLTVSSFFSVTVDLQDTLHGLALLKRSLQNGLPSIPPDQSPGREWPLSAVPHT